MSEAVGMENQKDCKNCSAERSSEPAPLGEVESPNADHTLPCLQLAEMAPASGQKNTAAVSGEENTASVSLCSGT